MAKEIPLLKTNRLVLRNIEVEDTSEIVRWRSDPNVYPYFTSPHTITVEEHLNWFTKIYLQDNNRYDWMALDKNGQRIGVFGLRRNEVSSQTAEINYILAPESRGCGYGGEAIEKLLDFAETLWGCDHVIAEIHEDNSASIRFATRLGMKLAAHKNQFLTYQMQLSGNRKAKKTIYIRVDGNASIGIGHVMRCLSIAEQIRNMGAKAVFITADSSISDLIQERNFLSITLDSVWDDLEQETDKLCNFLVENQVEVLLLDSYFVTENYLQKLNTHTRVFFIDDLNRMKYPVNALINYNIYGEEMGYDADWYEHLYLGPAYAPLRSEFGDSPKRKFREIKNVLVTSGGTDEYNLVGNILKYLLNDEIFSSLNYYCVLGKFNKNRRQLQQQYKAYENVHFLIDISNMSYYMKTCDVAITASGTTCYELCACGLPSILYTLADNQLGVAHSFSTKGILPYVGDIRESMSSCMENIGNELKKLSVEDAWNNQSQKMQTLVDGKGAYRIATILLD